MFDKTFFDTMFPSSGAAVTPADGSDLPKSGLLYVGGTGAVKVDTIGGDTLTFSGVPAGQYLGAPCPIRVKKVYATGTTATNMVAVYSKY